MANDIVLVPGRFAVIHPGHVRLLRYASSLCEEVIVALDTVGIEDEEVSWRVGALKGIPYVSKVVTTKSELGKVINELKPKFVLKGLEFRDSDFPEIEILNQVGGTLVFSSGNYLFSSEDEIVQLESKSSKVQVSVSDFMNRNHLDNSDVLNCLAKFGAKKILVLGDTIVDEIVMCHPLGMSQEEPTIVVTPVETRKFIGGAAIVASHAVGLGAETIFVSVVGNDPIGNWVSASLKDVGVNCQFIYDEWRKTTLKQRYRSGRQTLFRLTELTSQTIGREIQEKIYRLVEQEISNLHAIIFSDFSYGFFDQDLTKSIIQLARKHSVFTSADSQTSSQIGDLTKFVGVDLVTPTEKEARHELRDERSGLVQIAEGVQKKLECKNVLLKLGSDGVLLHGINANGKVLRTDRVDALNGSPVDVSGAGDSLLAGATLAMISGASIYGAALIGSIAAAVQVSRVGNTPITIDEIQQGIINL